MAFVPCLRPARSDEMAGRALKRLLSKLGASATTGGDPTLFMSRNAKYAGHDIGEWTYGRPDVPTGGEGGRLRIGRFCSIASGVTILLGHEHRLDWVSTYPFRVAFEQAAAMPLPSRTKGHVVIGHDVWIGMD